MELSGIIHKILQTAPKQSHACIIFCFKNFSWWFLVSSTFLINVRDETYPRHIISSRHETVNSSAHAKVLIRLNNKKLQSSTFTRFCCCGFPLLRAIHLLMLTCSIAQLAHVWRAQKSRLSRSGLGWTLQRGNGSAHVNCAHTRTRAGTKQCTPQVLLLGNTSQLQIIAVLHFAITYLLFIFWLGFDSYFRCYNFLFADYFFLSLLPIWERKKYNKATMTAVIKLSKYSLLKMALHCDQCWYSLWAKLAVFSIKPEKYPFPWALLGWGCSWNCHPHTKAKGLGFTNAKPNWEIFMAVPLDIY